MTTSLYDFVLSELQARKGSWQQICDDTGTTYTWLTKVACGQIANPGINNMQRLADHFASNPRG